MLLLNEAAAGPVAGVAVSGKRAHLLPVACGESCKEVGQLETDRALLLQGMRDGARRVYSLMLHHRHIFQLIMYRR